MTIISTSLTLYFIIISNIITVIVILQDLCLTLILQLCLGLQFFAVGRQLGLPACKNLSSAVPESSVTRNTILSLKVKVPA